MQTEHKGSMFFRQFLHDLNMGVRLQWAKYLPVPIIYLILILNFHCFTENALAIHNINHPPGFGDYLLYIFRGMDIYRPEFNEPFKIPVVWLLINLYTAFVVVSYPLKDLHGFGQQVLLRSNKKRLWWYSKCAWNIFSVLLCYFIGILIIFICAVIGGSRVLEPTQEIVEKLLNLPFSSVSETHWLVAILVFPALTSIALTLFQMILSLFIKPVLSYVVTICIIVVSAYYCSPFLIGNYSMFARNKLVLPQEGISFFFSVAVNIGLIVLCIFGGAAVFHKHDILEKQ